MNQRSKAPARVLAVLALAAGLVAIVLIVSSVGGDEQRDGRNRVGKKQGENRGEKAKKADGEKAAVYIVQSGDTLTGIAAKTGVSVAELQELNPGIDPQILVSGQRLKLR